MIFHFQRVRLQIILGLIQQFFRMGNLTALRELALRRAAERVDEQMRAYMETRSISGPWPAGERLLVCTSSNPFSERLVRTARRLADELKAEWFAVYVETPSGSGVAGPRADQAARILRLAEELGAKTLTLPGANVADTILEYARRHNITKIIAGKPVRPHLIDLWRGTVVDRLIQFSGNIDIYVISAEGDNVPQTRLAQNAEPCTWRQYTWSLALVAAATLLSQPIHTFVSPTNLVMLYLAAVVIAALYLGQKPAMLAAVFSVLSFDFFFIQPRFSFTVSDTEYLLTFVGLFAVSLVISTLASRSRQQAEYARQRESQAITLYELSRDLAAASTLDDISRVVIRHVSEVFDRQAAILLPVGEKLMPRATSVGLTIDDNEMAVALWTFRQGQPAGRGTDTLSATTVRCMPLTTARGVIGVLVIRPLDLQAHLRPEQRRLVEAFASQAALAIERAELAEQGSGWRSAGESLRPTTGAAQHEIDRTAGW